ncbi:hypothetical protein [Aquabacterium sp.]|uniref:hypothetical protein n=1 Tax=Aquabacterium sp. TaxID=1872578 RepID=UPI0035C68D06
MKILSTPPNTLVPRKAVWALAVCGATLLATPGVVCAENSPLSLTLSQNLRRDSNLLRSTNAQSDTVSTTAIRGDLSKAYGRQTIKASARFGRVSYDRFSQLDNDQKDLNASLTSSFASNWLAALNASDATSLNAPQDNPINNRLLRNVRHYKNVNGSLQYGNGGTWAVVGSFDRNRINYSEPVFQLQNAEQQSEGVRLVYNATDMLNFGIGPRFVRTKYPNNSTVVEAKDRNLDFTVNWQATGLSSLNALLSRRESTQGVGGGRNINAWTGSLGWNYTPRGRLSYDLSLTRATNADRFQDVQAFTFFGNNLRSVQNVALDTTTTALRASASAQVTGKISTGLSYGLTYYDISNDRSRSATGVPIVDQLLGNNASSSSSSSRLQNIGWSVNYAAYRWLGVNCALQFYKQTADMNRPRYSGHSVDCGASVTLDP